MADLTGALQAAAGTAASAGGATDPNFNQTVLLLHGDGTNGAQNNTFLDSSTNNFTITRNGNTTQGTFSPFSVAEGQWSNYFDGNGDYLSVANATAFDFTGDFTVEGWFYFSTVNQTGGETTLFSFDSINEFQINVISTGLRFTYKNTASIDGAYTVANLLNTWTHIATVRSGSTVTMYVNGNSVLSGTVASSFDTATLYIGVQTPGNNNHYFNGYMSNVSILKGTAKYTSAFTPSTTPLSLSATNQELLTCYSNRFIDANTATTAKTITVNGNPSVQPFSPFAPSAAYSTSVNGGSGYFDGTGDYLQVSDAALALSTGDFSIQFWVYNNAFDGSSGINTLIDYRNGSDPVISPVIFTTNGQLFFRTNGSNVISGSTLKLYEWSFIGISRSSGTTKMFVNGVQVGSDYSDTNNYTSSVIRIGADNDGTLNQELNGYMSGLKITQGAAVNFSTLGIPTAPPTADANTELLCNFTNAGIFDNTGKNNLETVADAQIDTTTKKYGTGSMEFDGTGDYLKISSSLENYAFGSGDFTIEIWGYLNNLSDNRQFYESYTGDGSGRLSIYVDTSGVVQVRGSGGATKTSGGTVSTSTWTHIAVTRASGSMRIFLDGVQVNTTYTDTAVYTASEPILIGVNGYQVPNFWLWNGFIDDLRITKGVARYTTTFTPPTAALPDL